MTGIERPGDKIKRLMREAVPENGNVADFAAAARKRGRPMARPAQVLKISGTNNTGVVGNHNQVTVNVKTPARRVRVEVQRGPGDITDAQAAEIQELVARVVAVSGKPFSLVWSALKKQFRFTRYQLIPAERFEEVRKYLRRWIASAAGKVESAAPAARQRALARIHAEAKKVPGCIDQVHSYIHGRFGTQSLGDLALGQLHEVIRQFSF